MTFEQEIPILKEIIANGGLILYPTDTIWGIGCDPFNQKAVEKIYALKQRSESKSLILLVDGITMLKEYVTDMPPKLITLHEYHIRPLTIVYPRTKNLPNYLLAEDQSIAIRIPKNTFCKTLIEAIGHPIVSTSANISGQPSPMNFDSIDPSLKKGVDYVVQYRQNDTHFEPPSVIATLNHENEIIILRP
jgi:L-threonylcarbamoyladenylate synthase